MPPPRRRPRPRYARLRADQSLRRPPLSASRAFKYVFQTTNFHQTNTLDNFGGAVSGKVLDGWAGPITAAFSGEMRFNTYDVDLECA